ncbi:MAG: biopolymer transporter ExbD [Bacteroidales bacterium]|nr:biopolymer transporter ExbD [Bacteroidales bacterium]
MAIKSRTSISTQFSLATMSDLVFLLLIFFMITSTLISPNALKLLLPKSNSQVQTTKPVLIVSITADLKYYIGTQQVPFELLESEMQKKVGIVTDVEKAPTISLHADKSVPIEEVVKIMNICRNNRYKMILATQPE